MSEVPLYYSSRRKFTLGGLGRGGPVRKPSHRSDLYRGNLRIRNSTPPY